MTQSNIIPPPPARVAARTTIWKAGRRLYRVHRKDYGPLQFNSGADGRSGRFHPIEDGRGRLIPTLYAADRIDGALSETVFHNVVAGGFVLRAELTTRVLSRIDLARDIKIVNLSGYGLRKLGLKRSQLLECEAPRYAETARWAAAIYRSDESLDGMVWGSRQFDIARALLAYGGRLDEDDFVVSGEPESLHNGKAYRRVQMAASAAGITIVEG